MLEDQLVSAQIARKSILEQILGIGGILGRRLAPAPSGRRWLAARVVREAPRPNHRPLTGPTGFLHSDQSVAAACPSTTYLASSSLPRASHTHPPL